MSFINQSENAADDGIEFDQDLFNSLVKENVDIEELPDKVAKKKKKQKAIEIEEGESDVSDEDLIERMNQDIEDNMEMFNEERKHASANKKVTAKQNKKLKKLERLKLNGGGETDEIQTVKTEKDEDMDSMSEHGDNEDDDYSEDVLGGKDDDDDDDFSDNPLRAVNNKKAKKAKKEKEATDENAPQTEEVNEEDQSSDDTDEEIENKKNKKSQMDEFDDNDNNGVKDHDYDTDEKAEIRAIAKKMLRKKKRLDIFYKSYNRYAFDDLGNAPKWFVEDEELHSKPNKPVTKDEIKREKEELREVNSKMPKKVLEAKNRKKRKIAIKMQKVKRKAQVIVNQDEINERSKITQIEKLYKRELSKMKEKKKYIVGKSYNRDPKNLRKGGRNVKFVDRTMKKEKRADKARAKRGKKKR